MVHRLAPEFRLDPDIVLAVVQVESNFDSGARSPKNAQGLMQLIPETADRFGVKDVWDPEQNLRGGMAYLRWLLDRFDGDLSSGACGLQRGRGRRRSTPGGSAVHRRQRSMSGASPDCWAADGGSLRRSGRWWARGRALGQATERVLQRSCSEGDMEAILRRADLHPAEQDEAQPARMRRLVIAAKGALPPTLAGFLEANSWSLILCRRVPRSLVP